MTHPQQQLITKWRANAARWEKQAREMPPGETAGHFVGSAAQAAYCADELEAALSAGAVPQPDKWAEFLAEWVDFNRGKGTSAEAWEAFMEQEHQHPPVTGCKCKICEAAGAVPQPHEGLADWLDMLRAGMERHQDTADLFMQEITGVESWARILRAGAVPQQEPQEPPSVACPVCGIIVHQVASATLSLALWQHWNWTCDRREVAVPALPAPQEPKGWRQTAGAPRQCIQPLTQAEHAYSTLRGSLRGDETDAEFDAAVQAQFPKQEQD